MTRHSLAIVGCGYVGTAVGRQLVRDGWSVLGTTTSGHRVAELEAAGIDARVVRVADEASLRDALAGRSIVLVTLAPARDAESYAAVYLEGMRHIVNTIDPVHIRRVIYTSSTGVYAQDDGSVVDEDSATQPTQANGRVLVATEQVLLQAGIAKDFAAIVVRLGGIYGPDRDPADRVIRLSGTSQTGGERFVNLIHIDDVVESLSAMMTIEFAGVLNLTDNHPITRRELYDKILADRSMAPIEWRCDPMEIGRGKRVSSDRAESMLGLKLRRHRFSI